MPHSPYLDRAYQLARGHRPHPNPRVGAVVVSSDGEVIGEGAHVAAGTPHAEVLALDGLDAAGSTVFVSLEPCAHQGQTPPCVDRLIAANVSKVVVGALDPDSRVSGAGVRALEEAGIEIEVVHDPAAEALDPGYFHHRRTGDPRVTLKYAMTVDGSVAAVDGSSQWITGPEARSDAHNLRAESDAVLIGAGTLAADDPNLDVRIEGYKGHQPRPVVVAGRSPLDADRKLWARNPLVFTPEGGHSPGGEQVPTGDLDRPGPATVCRLLAERGMYDILVEGGPKLAGSWWRSGVVNRLVVYIGSSVGGGNGMSPLGGVFETIGSAQEVTIASVVRFGADLRIDYDRI